MPATEVVVADTSPLLNLALIDQLDLVRDQFSTVTVTEQVWTELMAGEEGVNSLQSAHDDGTIKIITPEQSPLLAEFRRNLDIGEAATLAYAIETDADLVLLDEREARQTARRHDLRITGAVGILLRAAKNDDVELQTELDRLREAGFWISDELYETVLAEANEWSD